MANYARYDILLFDDWGLSPMSADESRNILELVEDRYDRNHQSSQVNCHRRNGLT